MTTSTASRLKKALAHNNMKQIELVEASGIGKSAISQYVSGKIVPKQDKIYILAKVLNVSEGWLMGYDVPMERDVMHYTEQKEKDVAIIIEQIKKRLTQNDLIFEGKPVSSENIQAILTGLQIGMETARKQIAEEKRAMLKK